MAEIQRHLIAGATEEQPDTSKEIWKCWKGVKESRLAVLRQLGAALLLSMVGLLLAVPATATEVKYDPGDKVYFTYCYAHPPAARIKPGDSVVTSTRDASNDVFSVSDKTVAAKLDLTKVNPQTGPFYVEELNQVTR